MTAILVLNRTLAVFALVLLAGHVVLAAGHDLPGPSFDSPDKKWRIQSAEPSDPDARHIILLTDNATGSTDELRRFNRKVNIIWAPDSARLAVTDFAASDQSDCQIITRSTRQTASVLQLLETTREANTVKGNHHVYVKCKRWVSPVALEFEVLAYGDVDPSGTTLHGRFDAATNRIISVGKLR